MAKQTPGLKQALKVVNQLGNKMTGEADADYGVALSALRAGQANLSKQTRALTRDSMLAQTQNRLAIRALVAKSKGSVAKVGEQTARTTNQYGSALGQSVAVSYKAAQKQAQASAENLLGQSRVAGANMRTAQVVAGIAQAGVAAQKQAAVYSLNQALQQRAIIDNQTLAALTGQLYQSAIDYNNQWSLWKKQQKYAERQAEQAAGPEAKKAVTAIIEQGGDIANGALSVYSDWRNAEDWTEESELNISEAATTWAMNNGYSPEGPETAVFIATLRNIKSGQATQTAFGNAISTLYGNVPGFDRWGDSLIEAGIARLGTDITADAITADSFTEPGAEPPSWPGLAGQGPTTGWPGLAGTPNNGPWPGLAGTGDYSNQPGLYG